MPKSMGRAARCALGVLSCLGLSVVLPSATATPAAPTAQESAVGIPFTQRYRAVQHGGIVRTANAAVTSRFAQGPSSRARLTLPPGSRVTYARLYWGGNLRVGEQKPPKDSGRALVAAPGGAYRELLADTRVGHRTADGSDAYQASADVTHLVRESRSGLWTVTQLNSAGGHTEAGVWGGWSLVVAYENSREPLRHLSLWDGFEALGPTRRSASVRLGGLRIPAYGAGRVGVVGYDGDRGALGDALSVEAGGGRRVWLGDSANPAVDLMNSTIADLGRTAVGREPAQVNTPGYDSDVFDLEPALTRGGDHLDFLFHAAGPGYFAGVLFVQADTRPR
ncbi:DUF3344 domain-containing protein [Streptomyces sp. A3M-1-3]|uniref:DUF3344 domain-containing protein n=1 Tax=Streptomyces sp. A3M-1-3 TaxID=2962044 RepID=UPI0020B6651A|nr:DUF3344 domain-containing protein [Streptomyces sp. A3M-1-3]MCP3820367.1 DUF3344 domain-containing protein [Streptomyces sp. A3M-1-3]